MNTAVAEQVTNVSPRVVNPQTSLVARVAARFHVDPDKMMATLKQTAFRQDGNDAEPSNEQMMALLVVADQYGLNPWTREIYAFPDKRRGIVPIVGLDGWSRIVNDHPQYDGVEFEYGPPIAKHKNAPEWIDCKIWRKDRTHPTVVREILAECYRATGPWDSHPSRMLRHKAFMQSGRLAFSFVGIYDEDEAQRIIEGESSRVAETSQAVTAINAEVKGQAAIENKPGEKVSSTIEGEKVVIAPGVYGEKTESVDVKKAERVTLPTAAVRAQLDEAFAAKSKDRLDEAAASIDLVASAADQKALLTMYREFVGVLEQDGGK